jgi:hypothetical protein
MELLQHFVTGLEVGKSMDFGSSLRVTPLFWNRAVFETERYLSIDEALDQGLAEMSEASYAGSVRQVEVRNFSDKYLLLFHGDAFKGAKQNRIMEQTVVVAPRSTMMVPVNCVERGRWSYKSAGFTSASYKATPSVKSASASLKKMGMDESIQSSVWSCVDECSDFLDLRSESSDFVEIMEKSPVQSDELQAYLQETACHGYLVQGAGNPFVEVFADAELCRNWAVKSEKGWFSDARMRSGKRQPIELLLEQLRVSQWTPAKAVGEETAYNSRDHHDGRITYHDGNLMHLFCSINPSDKHRL